MLHQTRELGMEDLDRFVVLCNHVFTTDGVYLKRL